VESHEVHRIRGFDERISFESPIVPAAVWLSDVYNRAVAGDVVVEETTYAGVWRGQVSVNRADGKLAEVVVAVIVCWRL